MSQPENDQDAIDQKARRLGIHVSRLAATLARSGRGFEIHVQGKGVEMSTSYRVFEGPVM